jgi:hypothetical protein
MLLRRAAGQCQTILLRGAVPYASLKLAPDRAMSG